MTMRGLLMLLAMASMACGRTTTKDAGVPPRQDGGEVRSSEDSSAGSGDRLADLPRSPDAARAPDSPSRTDAAGTPARFACSALAPLAAKGPFSSLATNKVLSTDDRSVVVLQATIPPGHGTAGWRNVMPARDSL